MPYEIEFSREAGEHLRGLTARQQAMLRDALRTQLVHQPAVETRNRKPMQGENPISPSELRVGDLRVYYDVRGRGPHGSHQGSGAQAWQPGPHRERGHQPMRTIKLADANRALADYANEPTLEPLIVTSKGKPVAVLVPLRQTEIPAAWISSDPEFLALMERFPARQKVLAALPDDTAR
jgi:prevent-host-death family protein